MRCFNCNTEYDANVYMNCPKCGAPHQPQPVYPMYIKCNNCGCEFDSITNKVCPSCKMPHYSYGGNAQVPEKKKGNGCVIILAILGGIFLFALIVSFFTARSDKSNSNYDQSTNNTDSSIVEESTEESTTSKDDFLKSCKKYTYKEIAREPNKYIGKAATFKGEVIQVVEYSSEIELRVNITETYDELFDEYDYSDTIYVTYERKSEDEPRVLEDDIITIYGTLNGIKSYESVMDSQVNIPWLNAEYINIEE